MEKRRWHSRLGFLALLFVGLALLALAVAPGLMSRGLNESRRNSGATTMPMRADLTRIRLLRAGQVIAHQALRYTPDSSSAQRYLDYRAEQDSAFDRLEATAPQLSAAAVQQVAELRGLAARADSAPDARMRGQMGEAQFLADFPRIVAVHESVTVALERLEAEVEEIEAANQRRASRSVQAQLKASTALGVVAMLAVIALTWIGLREQALMRALQGAMDSESRLRAEEAGLRALAEQQHDDLVRISESKNRLMRGFTHDVKNPIGAADGYMQLLENGIHGQLSDGQRRSVARVRASIKAALNLIGDLLDVARAETGNIHVAREAMDLADVARDAAEDFRAQAEAKGLALHIAVADDMPTVYSDPGRVRQVLGNMISNAVKYTPSGSVTVEVCTRAGRRAGDVPGAAVEITDTGPGIPAEKQRLLFREFTRLDPNAGPGAGIGLAISFKIVQALCGELTMRAGRDGGSTFVLWLPFDAGPVESGELSPFGVGSQAG